MEKTKSKKEIEFTLDELLVLHNLIYTELRYYSENNVHDKEMYLNIIEKLNKLMHGNLEV